MWCLGGGAGTQPAPLPDMGVIGPMEIGVGPLEAAGAQVHTGVSAECFSSRVCVPCGQGGFVHPLGSGILLPFTARTLQAVVLAPPGQDVLGERPSLALPLLYGPGPVVSPLRISSLQ